MDDWRAWIRDLVDNWEDPYWRADHPEVVQILLAIIVGLIGLAFALLEATIQAHYLKGA
jgi:hypothetical protein